MMAAVVSESHCHSLQPLLLGRVPGGGRALTVLEVVGLRGGREAGKAEGLRLLSAIADRGRQFKELLCESFGECVG